jgi:hypothetical protein
MDIRLKRELDFEVVCVRTGCDLTMEPFLESKKPIDGDFE